MRRVTVSAFMLIALASSGAAATAGDECCHITINKVAIGGPTQKLARYEWTTSGRSVFSRDHRWVLFQPRGIDYGTDRLRIANVDGTGEHQVVQAPGSISDFALAPDQRRIALSTYETPYGGMAGIWVVNIDGTGMRRIAAGDRNVVWAPNSRRLAFEVGDAVRVVNVDGSNEREIARGAAGFGSKWSPDGRFLAFSTRGGIRIALVAGGRTRLVAKGQRAQDPTWSPDGKRLAFHRHDGVWVVPARGGRAVSVVRRAASASYPEALTWSPRGKRLAYITRNGRVWVVCVVKVTRGARCRRVAEHRERWLVALSWSRDGRSILYLTDTPD
jgi:Tol biopolymer transport system component